MRILKDILTDLDYELVAGDLHTGIGQLQFDSRKVKPVIVFVCGGGPMSTDNQFIHKALEKRSGSDHSEKAD
jgi:UDP-N-acetylmuramoyl-L-alanyl-D-glutamate--2,6-diaminopimelate ligase